MAEASAAAQASMVARTTPEGKPTAEVRKLAPVSPDSAATSAPPPKKRGNWKRPLLFALLPVALIGGGYEYVTGGQVMETDNAYVHAKMEGVSTDVAGTVIAIEVHVSFVLPPTRAARGVEMRKDSVGGQVSALSFGEQR